MELETAGQLLLAVAIAHGVHTLFEPVNIRSKLADLGGVLSGKPPRQYPVNIDSRPKAYLAALLTVAVAFGIGWLIAALTGPEPRTAIFAAIAIMAVVEIVNTAVIDRYHVEIGVLTERYGQRGGR